MLRAVLFDLGDTLLDFHPMDARALFRQGAWNTYQYLRQQAARLPTFERYCKRQLFGVRWSYLWAKLRRREFNTLTRLKHYTRAIGLHDDDALLHELAWRWYEPFSAYTSIEPDLLATLEQLRRWNLKLAVVSNTFLPGVVLDRHLALYQLLDFFPVRVYSSELGYRKPDRRIFQHALDQISVPATDALFIGDLVKTDIVGARRMGMRTVIKQPWGVLHTHTLADHAIRRVAELLPIIRQQLDG